METQGPIQMPEIQFENLQQPPPLNEILLAQLDSSIKGSNWTDSHQCITMIRSINKYFPQFVPDIMNRYSSAILDLISNGKTQILKNVFKLIKETFLMGQQINVERSVYAFLPVLLKKASTEIGHIKDLAQEVLTAFSANCGYDVSFLITAQSICDKSSPVSALSLKLLAKLVEKVGPAITQLSPNTLQVMMKALATLIDGKRADAKTWALDICLYICNLIGSENYLSLMTYSLKLEEVQSMGNSMETHRTSKAKNTPSLASMLKQRRTIMMKEQNQNVGNMSYTNNYKDCNPNTNNQMTNGRY